MRLDLLWDDRVHFRGDWVTWHTAFYNNLFGQKGLKKKAYHFPIALCLGFIQFAYFYEITLTETQGQGLKMSLKAAGHFARCLSFCSHPSPELITVLNLVFISCHFYICFWTITAYVWIYHNVICVFSNFKCHSTKCFCNWATAQIVISGRIESPTSFFKIAMDNKWHLNHANFIISCQTAGKVLLGFQLDWMELIN
jgi:hypothetical protein